MYPLCYLYCRGEGRGRYVPLLLSLLPGGRGEEGMYPLCYLYCRGEGIGRYVPLLLSLSPGEGRGRYVPFLLSLLPGGGRGRYVPLLLSLLSLLDSSVSDLILGHGHFVFLHVTSCDIMTQVILFMTGTTGAFV